MREASGLRLSGLAAEPACGCIVKVETGSIAFDLLILIYESMTAFPSFGSQAQGWYRWVFSARAYRHFRPAGNRNE
jgi:hypothetical protein